MQEMWKTSSARTVNAQSKTRPHLGLFYGGSDVFVDNLETVLQFQNMRFSKDTTYFFTQYLCNVLT